MVVRVAAPCAVGWAAIIDTANTLVTGTELETSVGTRVSVGTTIRNGVFSGTSVSVGLAVGNAVRVVTGVFVGFAVGDGVRVGTAVSVGPTVDVLDGLAVLVRVGVSVVVGVAVTVGTCVVNAAATTVSVFEPNIIERATGMTTVIPAKTKNIIAIPRRNDGFLKRLIIPSYLNFPARM